MINTHDFTVDFSTQDHRFKHCDKYVIDMANDAIGQPLVGYKLVI